MVGTSLKNPLRTKPWKKHQCFVPGPAWGVLGAASRVCDERSDKKRRTALDPAPSTRRRSVPKRVLDNADDIIDAPPAVMLNIFVAGVRVDLGLRFEGYLDAVVVA